MGLGDYEGGQLRVFGTHGVTDVDTRNRWVRFDGRYPHEVRPYRGTRYSVVFFQLVPPWDVDPDSIDGMSSHELYLSSDEPEYAANEVREREREPGGREPGGRAWRESLTQPPPES